MFIDGQCQDPLYANPVIEATVDEFAPVPLRRVTGRFDGTDKRFTIYLPPKREFDGRFFQHMYPLDDEIATDDHIEFAMASGSYLVKTNSGGGYRMDAAAAKFARTVAADYYSTSDHLYGYAWGGSGGAYQIISAAQNTRGVWDGLVPFVVGPPVALPSFFFIRAFARFFLEAKAIAIADAVAPGGSGDPLAVLDDVERAAFIEVSRFGVPERAWENYQYLLGLSGPTEADGVQSGDLFAFLAVVQQLDPTYVDDFWSEPGYLGTEESPLGQRIRSARVDAITTVADIECDAAGRTILMTLTDVPDVSDAVPAQLSLEPGGQVVPGDFDSDSGRFIFAPDNPADVAAGATVRIDNRWSLAALSYGRHQVPGPGFDAFDQYRSADGNPLYPQRPIQIGPVLSASVTDGAPITGAINTKMIQVGTLLDTDAYPWGSDWYRRQVQNTLGADYHESYRIWFNDNAYHLANSDGRAPNLINYNGIVQQSLRDIAAWVERGQEPPDSTAYAVADSQVTVSGDPVVRRGIQPVVELSAVEGAGHPKAGVPVDFTARVSIPPGSGTLISAEWSPLGNDESTIVPVGAGNEQALPITATFDSPGTYFPRLKVTVQRDGDTETQWGLVENLGRIRIDIR